MCSTVGQSRRMTRRKAAMRVAWWSALLPLLLLAGTTSESSVTVPSNSSAVSSSTAECLRRAPSQMNAAERESLCGSQKGTVITAGPAECARSSMAIFGGQKPLVIELCRGAKSLAPSECAAVASSGRLSLSLTVQLCSAAESNAPADCFLAAERAAASHQDTLALVQLCKGATDTAPATCASSMPRWVSADNITRICSLATQEDNGGRGPAECVSKMGSAGGAREAIDVCRGARSVGPAECFRAAGKGNTSLSLEARLNLCREAQSAQPFKCFSAASSSLSQEDKIALCSSAAEVSAGSSGSSSSAAKCSKAAPHTLSGREIAVLCKAAPQGDHLAPIRCFQAVTAVSPLTPLPERLRLCARNGAPLAETCVRALPRGRYTDAVGLCERAAIAQNPKGPAECIKKVKMELLSFAKGSIDEATSLTTALCSGGSGGAAAAECFNHAPQELSLKERVELCKDSTSVDSADCARAALPESHRQTSASDEGFCPFRDSERALRESRVGGGRYLSSSLIVMLCKGEGQTRETAQCALSAPGKISDEDLGTLCRGGGGYEAANCAKRAPWYLTGAERAELCAGATSVGPAECAELLAGRFASDIIIMTCREAQSDMPAACLNSVGKGGHKGATESDIVACRHAVPVPTGLSIESLSVNWRASGTTPDSRHVYSGMPVEARLHVLDQWGRDMSKYDTRNGHNAQSTIVVASVGRSDDDIELDPRGGRYNASVEGVVMFESLTFTAPGNATVFFTIGNTHDNTPAAAAKVVVLEPEPARFSRTCIRSIFDNLACPAFTGDTQSVREGATLGGDVISNSLRSIGMEVTGVLDKSHAWLALVCQQHLEQSGILHLKQQSDGDVTLWYFRGIEMLETGYGLPTSSMEPHEVLGVPLGSGKRQIRRSYYDLSLLWHPDRWEKYPTHRRRAENIFSIVADAYMKASPSPSVDAAHSL